MSLDVKTLKAKFVNGKSYTRVKQNNKHYGG